MNKAAVLVLLTLLISLSFGKVASYASDDKVKLNLNNAVKIDESNIFQISGEGKNKTQFRTKQHKNNDETEFMLKGVIDASSANSLTIDGKVINIDSEVTEEVKIVGTIKVGAYAMVKGEIKDSSYFAEKIVVDQRNKIDDDEDVEDIDEDEDEDATVSATPTPTISEDEDEDATMTAQLDFSVIINTIQSFLNYLRDIASRI